MARIAQIGIAISALGAMIMLMALFPGVVGLEPTVGMGVVQIFTMLIGFSWFIFGALFYVKFAFYTQTPSNLTQQIGTRLALTGIVLAAMSGLADALGFGSHGVAIDAENFLGPLQAVGILGSYFMSCLGVLIYSLGGRPEDQIDESEEIEEAQDQDDAKTSTPIE